MNPKMMALSCAAFWLGLTLGVSPAAHAWPKTEGMPRFMVIANHGSYEAPSESAHAYQIAQNVGADYLEGNLRVVKDRAGSSVVILCNEPDLSSFTDVEDVLPSRPKGDLKYPVENYLWEELSLLRPGKHFNQSNPRRGRIEYLDSRILRLEEWLELSRLSRPSAGLVIELKSDGLVQETVKILRQNGVLPIEKTNGMKIPKLIFHSSDLSELKELRELAPEAVLGWVAEGLNPDHILEKAKEAKVDGIFPRGDLLGKNLLALPLIALKWKSYVSRAHKAGLFVAPYVLNSLKLISIIKLAGADGVFTDDPRTAVKVKGRKPPKISSPFPENMSESMRFTRASGWTYMVGTQAEVESVALESANIGRPFILTNGSRSKNVIVLLPGLLDSPYTYKDVAKVFNDMGWSVVVPQLSGLGTRSEHLHEVRSEMWREDVRFALDLAHDYGDNVFIGGLSTGGMLAIEAAQDYPKEVKGLFLASTAFQTAYGVAFLSRLPVLGTMPWAAINPFDRVRENNPVRYVNMSLNGVAQLLEVIRRVESRAYPKIPSFSVITEGDDTADVKVLFEKTVQMTESNPQSRAVVIKLPSAQDGLEPQRRVDPALLERISQNSQVSLVSPRFEVEHPFVLFQANDFDTRVGYNPSYEALERSLREWALQFGGDSVPSANGSAQSEILKGGIKFVRPIPSKNVPLAEPAVKGSKIRGLCRVLFQPKPIIE